MLPLLLSVITYTALHCCSPWHCWLDCLKRLVGFDSVAFGLYAYRSQDFDSFGPKILHSNPNDMLR